jgi:hypothetical protein
MALLRRRVRKELLTGLYLTAANVKSHINGSITIAVRRSGTFYSVESLKNSVQGIFARNGREDMFVAREGYTNGDVLYVTYTSQAMVDEAIGRYGIRTMQYVLNNALEQVEAGTEWANVVTEPEDVAAAMQDEDFDFDAVPVLAGTELEDSER